MSMFDEAAAPVPLEAQIACVEREITFRVRVYARRVAEGKMSQEKSDQELAAMRAVLGTLRGHAALKRRFDAMLPLFQEARDALPAIPLASAKLRGLRLDLADRMDDVGVPSRWREIDAARMGRDLATGATP